MNQDCRACRGGEAAPPFLREDAARMPQDRALRVSHRPEKGCTSSFAPSWRGVRNYRWTALRERFPDHATKQADHCGVQRYRGRDLQVQFDGSYFVG